MAAAPTSVSVSAAVRHRPPGFVTTLRLLSPTVPTSTCRAYGRTLHEPANTPRLYQRAEAPLGTISLYRSDVQRIGVEMGVGSVYYEAYCGVADPELTSHDRPRWRRSVFLSPSRHQADEAGHSNEQRGEGARH